MLSKKTVNELHFGCENINKRYGKNLVLDHASFNISNNGIIGLFGLNGAGKSTLFRILSGHDSDFNGTILNTDFLDISFMSLNNYFPPDMRVKDLLKSNKLFIKNQNTSAIEKALEESKIRQKSLIISLSSGMRQYLKFLTTIYSGACVCLFDEPLTNLDVNIREKVIKALIMEASEEKIFLIATHEIKEFEKLIDGFYILKNGKLSAFYNSENIVSSTGKSIGESYKEKVNEK